MQPLFMDYSISQRLEPLLLCHGTMSHGMCFVKCMATLKAFDETGFAGGRELVARTLLDRCLKCAVAGPDQFEHCLSCPAATPPPERAPA